MKISVFSALYPPEVIGGAEISAANLNFQLSQLGHTISVLATKQGPNDDYPSDRVHPNIEVERVLMPRPYAALNYAPEPTWKKAIWHGLDHAAAFNVRLWRDFLNRTRPDAAIVQVTQGLGYNGLSALAASGIPTVYVIHDLGLACYRTSMFKNGHNCETLCTVCKVSNAYKRKTISRFKNLGFVAPSGAILNKLAPFVPIRDHPSTVILNPNTYPAPRSTWTPHQNLRLLYVGQITENKGVEFLVKVFRDLKSRQNGISLTIVGDGPELERLRHLYATIPGLQFTGKVSIEDVAEHMAQSDLLCVPSLWFDNSPGVIIQALGQGLPVLGSRYGGIVELIDDQKAGLLLAPGDAEAWTATIANICADMRRVREWREYAMSNTSRFQPKNLAAQYETFIQSIIETSKVA